MTRGGEKVENTEKRQNQRVKQKEGEAREITVNKLRISHRKPRVCCCFGQNNLKKEFPM